MEDAQASGARLSSDPDREWYEMSPEEVAGGVEGIEGIRVGRVSKLRGHNAHNKKRGLDD